MAILVEATSVVVRVEPIRDRFVGGWSAFLDQVPNRTFCSDNELARVGFMSPEDCKRYVVGIEKAGLCFLRDGKAQDVVVADQMRGFTALCDWAEFGRIKLRSGQTVSAAQLKGTSSRQLFCPEDWKYEGSLSEQFGFVPTGQEHKSLTLLHREGGMEVYLNRLTGKEVYVGRAGQDPVSG
ncbi:MAG TPA: hypothetical protein VH684_21585 [Xanthobacteraceae bacterium]|jgi:hypothetical protein